MVMAFLAVTRVDKVKSRAAAEGMLDTLVEHLRLHAA